MAFIKFPANQAVRLTFDSANARSQKGQYGMQFMYDVNGGDTLGASDYLNNVLMETNGFGKGAVVDITKNTSKGRTRWDVELVRPGEASDGSEAFTSPAESFALRGEAPRQPGKKLFMEVVEDYKACLAHARDICTAELADFTNEDIRSIATSLMIQAQRDGLEIPGAADPKA